MEVNRISNTNTLECNRQVLKSNYDIITHTYTYPHTHTPTHTHITYYILVCVCVCACDVFNVVRYALKICTCEYKYI